MALKDWRKDKWDKNGRWWNTKTKEELSIGDNFAGVIHIFLNKDRTKAPSGSHTIKVVKSKSQALSYARTYMRSH